MVTVVVSPPGTNEAGAVTLPETIKLSVPSSKKSSMISIEALQVLPVVSPRSNVTSCLSRWKSSPSTKWWKRKIVRESNTINGMLNTVNYLQIENANAL